MQIHNRKYLKKYRRNLRNQGTPAEAYLWNFLKSSQLGRKFRRQHSIANFIVDFYCPAENLVIELDGDYHFTEEGISKDQERDNYLRSLGITILRFENKNVFDHTETVLEEIKKAFQLPVSETNSKI